MSSNILDEPEVIARRWVDSIGHVRKPAAAACKIERDLIYMLNVTDNAVRLAEDEDHPFLRIVLTANEANYALPLENLLRAHAIYYHVGGTETAIVYGIPDMSDVATLASFGLQFAGSEAILRKANLGGLARGPG